LRTDKQLLLFTDFGPAGPYLGQMESVLRRLAPDTPVIHLLSDAPTGDPKPSSYLLAALRHGFPPGSIFLAIVDPGVGGTRKPVVLCADGQYFVGPDNGLFNTVAVQAEQSEWVEIVYKPADCSMSFHGRDIFAPVAAHLANGSADGLLKPMHEPVLHGWPADLSAVIYFDYYGNAMTGLRYREFYDGRELLIRDQGIRQADSFCSVTVGEPFWYKNSSGLIEIAVNRGRARQRFNLQLGDAVAWR
jgi:S-adenosylmethionine hydrolase